MGNITLFWPLNNQTYEENEYCLHVEGTTVKSAEVCKKKVTRDKFQFYPYILIFSCVCLVLTLLVYTFVPRLLNFYNKLVRQYTLSLLIACLVLAITQLSTNLSETKWLCHLCGNKLFQLQSYL